MAVRNSYASRAQRHNPSDNVEFYPTPAWATRALCERIQGYLNGAVVWEPAAGCGHMAEALSEVGAIVVATDLHNHKPNRYETRAGIDFLDEHSHANFRLAYGDPSWVITNPPFNAVERFISKSMEVATNGVAIFGRLALLEGIGRYNKIFQATPPWMVLPFSERVAIHKSKVKSTAKTATSYAWFIWRYTNGCWGYPNHPQRQTALSWIPPGTRARLQRPEDYDDLAVQA